MSLKNSKLSKWISLVVVGVLIAGYQLYSFTSEAIPQMEQEKAKMDTIVRQKETELGKLQQFSQNIENIKKELRELNLQLESALEHMPRNFNLAGLLRRLTMLAQNSGVELISFKPKKGEEKKEEAAFYSTTEVDLDIKGGFTQTLVFLDQLSRLKRIVNIENLNMKMPTENLAMAGNKLGAIPVSTQTTIKTYRFSETF